ncbi:MAG: inorganic phosphate transporter [Clostridia bacterium]|nr:inorganic phosphate transporter [Clostridia bacterium]
MSFLTNLDTPSDIFTLFLALAVVFLNGFTDAPNSIASCVGTKAMKMKKACILCAIFNFLGVFLTLQMNASVAKSVFEFADFSDKMQQGVIASLATVCIFSAGAWLFSMPSSESHALIGAIAGVSLAIGNEFENSGEFLKILGGVAVSCVVSFFISFAFCKLLGERSLPYNKLQTVSAALSSFAHGAQDGQKFVGIIMLLCVSENTDLGTPVSIILTVSIVMALGALLGGGRIIKTLSEKTVKLSGRSAFASDISSFASAMVFSLVGMPVSTSNIKACALMGAGSALKEKINKKTATSLLITTLLTFPVCIALGYIITKLIILF